MTKDKLLEEAIARRDESRAMILRTRRQRPGIHQSDPAPAPKAEPETSGGNVEDRSKVDIPENWHDMPWIPKEGETSLRSLASELTDQPIRSKADAVAAVEAELTRRNGQ